MKFLVNANLGRKFTNLLKEAGYDAVLIKDVAPKATDEEVLFLAVREKRIIITNDKDFGELIFQLGRPTSGLILLRTLTTNPEKRFELVSSILDKAKDKFIVVSESRIRMRRL